MRRLPEFDDLARAAVLVDYSPGFKLGEFDCGIKDYNDFLQHDANYYVSNNLCKIKLLIDKQTANVIGYMALCTDSFRLNDEEKERQRLDVPFNAVPALKIGKLAVDVRYNGRHFGLFLLWLAFAIASEISELGVGCRFLSVDADTEFKKETPDFYAKAGFVINIRENKGRNQSVSMRFDIQYDR